MKKNVFCLLSVLFVLNIFISCDSDDDKKEGWQQVATTYKDEALKLSVNGTETTGKSVTITTSSDTKATVTLNGIVPGEKELTIDATMLQTKSGENFQLQGESKTDLRTVSISGSVIAGGDLTLNVTLKMTSTVVGTWGIAPMSDVNGDGKIDEKDFVSPFYVKLENASGTVSFKGQTISNQEFTTGLSMAGGQVVASHLRAVTFAESGDVSISYSVEGNENITSTPAGMISYYVKDGMVYLIPDITALMSKSTGPGAGGILTILETGIPLKFNIVTEAGTTDINLYLDKSMLQTLLPIANLVLGNIQSESDFVKLLKEALPDLSAIVTDSQSFEMGLNLVKK